MFSSAIKPDNPEIVAAHEAGERIVHRSDILALLMNAKRAVTVAGAHGKTTTSSMLAHILVNAGEGEYVTEYRVYKGSDWADSEISLDLEDLVAELAALCDPYYEHEQPIYEM